MTHGAGPEKSTHQLGVWRDLVDALDQLEIAWQNAKAAGALAPSAQLPANIATALAKATERGAAVIAETADTLVVQLDSGDAFQNVAHMLREAVDSWPRRR